MRMLPEIDAYIADAPEYALPILEEIRSIFHAADAGIEEAVKWNAPHFVHDGIVGSMTAFKNHVRLIFWRGQLLEDSVHLLAPVGSKTDMGSVDIRTLDNLPDDLREALEDHPEALNSYTGLSPSRRREYTEWITEARREETRSRRIVTAVEWLAEGKPRNWKYMNKWRSGNE